MEQKKPTLFFKILGTLLFSLFTFWCGYLFYYYISPLITGVINQEHIIVFAKTGMCSLGVVLFFLPILISAVSEIIITNKSLDDKITIIYKKYTKYMIIIPFLIMLIFPQIVRFLVFQHIEKINYIECSEQSTYEFRFTKYVFAKDLETCQTYEE